MPDLWNIARSAALAAHEVIIQIGSATGPAQEPRHRLATGGSGNRLLAAALRQLGAEPASGLQSAFSSDQRVPRLPHGIHDLPGGQGGNDLLDHPAKAGRGRPRARGSESGDLAVAHLVFREAHGSAGRLRWQFLRLACRRIGLQYSFESPAQAGCGAADARVPRRPWRIDRSSSSPSRTWPTALPSASPATTRYSPWEYCTMRSSATRITGAW